MSAKPASYYNEGIILFGFIFPILIFGAIVGGGYFLSDQAASYLAKKKAAYSTYEANRKGLQQLEEVFGRKRLYLDEWQKSIAADTNTTFSTNLSEISSGFSGEEFTRTTMDPSGSAAGFGIASAQPSSSLKLSTRGTFRATQKAMLMLETKMPQLQLQEVKIEPSTTSSSALNFQFSYTAWEK